MKRHVEVFHLRRPIRRSASWRPRRAVDEDAPRGGARENSPITASSVASELRPRSAARDQARLPPLPKART
jgi:hypothetical protein